MRHLFWEMLQEVLYTNKLSQSSQKGIISLLPKKGKDPRVIKNLRPLTLLNTDYKILAKILASRLNPVLPDIIGDQQTGFMAGRQISSNLRQTIDVISHVYQAGKRAVVVSIDFEKCFDKIKHASIKGAMEYFNFGPKFTAWVQILYNDFYVCTQNAGYTLDFFLKSRGCNQGCNYSPFGFIICSEVMTHMIRNNPEIKGIKMSAGTEKVITQFADDTGLFLMYTESCINAAIATLVHIEHNTGLKVSYDKTCIYRIGSLKGSQAQCYTIRPLMWSDGDIEMLGLTISNGSTQTEKGFDMMLQKMQGVVATWYERQLTLIGRISIVNTLFSSLFTYKMQVLPLMNKTQIQTFY